MILPLNFKNIVLLAAVYALTIAISIAQEWDNAKIGGGGRTVGIIASPTSNKVYVRTDVAGMYVRTSVSDNTWRRLTTNFGPWYGEPMSGCAGLGVHPSDDKILYAALSRGIYKSVNSGGSWNRVLNISVKPNGTQDDRNDRNYGEALVVDQQNGNVVYYGSQGDGLWSSTNAGKDWIKITNGIPGDARIRNIVVDNTREMTKGRSEYIYVGVKGGGIYRSTNGGDRFSHWQADLPPNNGDYVRWLRLSKDGDLYAAHNNGLARWDGSSWSNVTPGPSKSGEVTCVATDPHDDAKLLCFHNGRLKRTSNRGGTWTNVPTSEGDMPGWSRNLYRPAGPDVFAVYFDRMTPGKAYVCSNYYPWVTKNIWASNTTWDAIYKGNEMTIHFAGVSLPNTNGSNRPDYIAGMADVRGFRYVNNLTSYPTQRVNLPNAQFSPNITGLDFCEGNPDVVWATASRIYRDDQGREVKYRCAVYRSSNAGASFSYVGNPFGNGNAGGPKIAVSATNGAKALLAVKGKCYYTTNSGSTWGSSGGIRGGDGFLFSNIEYEFDQAIASDRVNGNKFYLVSPNGTFYRSTNGGASFTRRDKSQTGLPNRRFNRGVLAANAGGGIHIAAAPGMEEEVWIAMGASGIWRSSSTGSNKTDTFSRVPFFANDNPTCLAWGKNHSSTTNPTIYVYGKQSGANGKWGVWRSTNLGDTWTRITPGNDPGQWPRFMAADRQNYGRVYVGDAFTGIRFINSSGAGTPRGARTAAMDQQSLEQFVKEYESLKVYPNPTTGQLHVNIPSRTRSNITFHIFNPLGKTIRKGSLEMQSDGMPSSIDLNQVEPGIYVIEILEGNNALLKTKFIKE